VVLKTSVVAYLVSLPLYMISCHFFLDTGGFWTGLRISQETLMWDIIHRIKFSLSQGQINLQDMTFAISSALTLHLHASLSSASVTVVCWPTKHIFFSGTHYLLHSVHRTHFIYGFICLSAFLRPQRSFFDILAQVYPNDH
jgi:hypothetical protein